MKGVAGFRQHKTITGVSGTLGAQYTTTEVTNSTGDDILFYVNDFPGGGHPASDGIPIKAGTTRIIPMIIYNFTSSGIVTVVAYGM